MTAAVLAFALRLLPRDDWARAMRAELATLDDPREQRRFALGCLRALLTRPARWLRVGVFMLVAAVPAFLFTGPGGNGDVVGITIAGIAIAVCLLAATQVEALPVVARMTCAAGLVWWTGLLASATVRANPQWALALIVACVAGAAWRGGARAALGTAFAACLMIFVVAVGTYAALPRLAPPIAPANATNPQLENQIESTDPYVGELLLAALCGVMVLGAARVKSEAR